MKLCTRANNDHDNPPRAAHQITREVESPRRAESHTLRVRLTFTFSVLHGGMKDRSCRHSSHPQSETSTWANYQRDRRFETAKSRLSERRAEHRGSTMACHSAKRAQN